MSRVQGLVASARGETALARQRLSESVAGWQRIAGTTGDEQAGAGYVAALIDLGRPPVSSLIEPAREAAIASAELSALHPHPTSAEVPATSGIPTATPATSIISAATPATSIIPAARPAARPHTSHQES